MLTSEPDYPYIVLSFDYRDWKLDLDKSDLEEEIIYAVWAKNGTSVAVAVPYAPSRTAAIKQAKRWVDNRLSL